MNTDDPPGEDAGETARGGLPAGAEYLSDGSAASIVPPAADGGGPAGGGWSGRTPRRLLALGVSAALVVGIGIGGVYAAQQLSGGGDQPAARVPAGAIAYLAVDLDPAAGQKVQALRFLRAAPDAAERLGDTDDLRRAVFDLLDLGALGGELDWERDVEPWLGDRAAVAGLAPAPVDEAGDASDSNDSGDPNATGMAFASGQPEILIVLQVTDEGAAREALERVTADEDAGTGVGGFVVRDGWAVVGATQRSVDNAVRDAAAANLADDPEFRADQAALGERGIATCWVDAKALGDLILAGLDGSAASGTGFQEYDGAVSDSPVAPPEPALASVEASVPAAPALPAPSSGATTATALPLPGPSADPAAPVPPPTGDVLTEEEYTELGMLFERQAEGNLTAPEEARLAELSERLGIADPSAGGDVPLGSGEPFDDSYLEDYRRQVEASYVGRYAGTLRFDGDALELVVRGTGVEESPALGADGSVDLADLPGSTVGAVGLVHGGALIGESWDAESGSAVGGPLGPLNGFTGIFGLGLGGGEVDGLDLPDDLVALFGEEAVLAVDSAGLAEDDPAVGARLRTDGERAEAALGRLDGLIPEAANLTTRRTADGLVASTTAEHADALALGSLGGALEGPLGDSARYAGVLGGSADGGDADLAFFVDLGAIGEAMGEPDLSAWGAVGGWVSSDGDGELELTVRLTTG